MGSEMCIRDRINPVVSSVSFIFAEAAASLPFSGLMGFGAYEGAFSIIMKATNNIIPAEITVVFVVHLITQIVGYTIGILGALAFVISNRKQTTRL